MKAEDCGLCMLPDLQDNSNDFSVVDRISIGESLFTVIIYPIKA